jgi:hypothetical protein
VNIGPSSSSSAWWSALALTGAGFLLLAKPLGARTEHVVGLPWQIYRIATDRLLRRNHALEHATLNVYTEKFGAPQLNGVAVRAGFVMRGLVNPRLLLASATEGLERLRAGETALAYHPRCGTSLGTADLLTWLVLVALLAMTGRLTWTGLAAGVAVAAFGGPLAGKWVQRGLTTSVDLAATSIAGVTVKVRPAPQGGAAPATPDEVWGEVVVLVRHDDAAGAARE